MPVPAFGFSVGDFVAVTGLVWQLCQLLDDASPYVKLFRDIQLELFAFNGVLLLIQQSMMDGVHSKTKISKATIDTLQKTLEQAKETVVEFTFYVKKFKEDSTREAGGLVKFKKRLSWSFSGKKKVEPFRQSMSSFSSVLMLSIQTLTR